MRSDHLTRCEGLPFVIWHDSFDAGSCLATSSKARSSEPRVDESGAWGQLAIKNPADGGVTVKDKLVIRLKIEPVLPERGERMCNRSPQKRRQTPIEQLGAVGL